MHLDKNCLVFICLDTRKYQLSLLIELWTVRMESIKKKSSWEQTLPWLAKLSYEPNYLQNKRNKRIPMRSSWLFGERALAL